MASPKSRITRDQPVLDHPLLEAWRGSVSYSACGNWGLLGDRGESPPQCIAIIDSDGTAHVFGLMFVKQVSVLEGKGNQTGLAIQCDTADISVQGERLGAFATCYWIGVGFAIAPGEDDTAQSRLPIVRQVSVVVRGDAVDNGGEA